MSDSWSGGSEARPSSGAEVSNRPLRLDNRTIFRELIARELRCGRLTAAQRARIVRYASQMGLSAVETGELIAECRAEALRCGDAQVRGFALRLVEPATPRIPTHVKIAAAVLIALIIDVLVVRWLW
jgi:hypothetical protein